MPTLNEINELRNNCTWKWITQNGMNGRLVIGPNGNSIFLPATGNRYGTDLFNRGFIGLFWSATLNENFINGAYELCIGSGVNGDYLESSLFNCSDGHSVRPVSE